MYILDHAALRPIDTIYIFGGLHRSPTTNKNLSIREVGTAVNTRCTTCICSRNNKTFLRTYLSTDQVGGVTVAEVLHDLVSDHDVLIPVGQKLRRLHVRTTMSHMAGLGHGNCWMLGFASLHAHLLLLAQNCKYIHTCFLI